MGGTTKIAKKFKERDNQPYLGPQIGIVITPPPNIKVSYGDKGILENHHLIIAAHVLRGYTRNVEITADKNNITLRNPPLPTNPSTTTEYSIMDLTINGQMEYIDTLKEGDEVILIPSTDNQTYFLIDKAVRL